MEYLRKEFIQAYDLRIFIRYKCPVEFIPNFNLILFI